MKTESYLTSFYTCFASRYDLAAIYYRRRLDIWKKISEGDEKDHLNILTCFEDLIECQVRAKQYVEALETFDEIKNFNLNTTDDGKLDFSEALDHARKLYKARCRKIYKN